MSKELMSINMAMRTVDRYVCAHCWGKLIAQRDKETGLFFVKCTTEGCKGEGFVTINGVERRESESEFEAMNARTNLRDIIPTQHKEKSADQLLSEMGF